MIIRSKTEKVYYPTSAKKSDMFRGSGRVRYFRLTLLIRPKAEKDI